MRTLLLVVSALAAPTAADTLPDAIASAYATNPEIAAQRATVREIDEQVPQALSATRPTLSPTASLTENLNQSFGDSYRTFSIGGTVSQAVYRGGRTRAAVSAGEQRIEAARQRLRSAENRVIVGVVTAYADVIRTARVVALNENNVRVLQRQLQASQDRFQVGDLTRTDVAQSEARLAAARSQLIGAQGQALAANQAYLRVVGRPPARLEPLPALPAFPDTVARVVDEAQANAPDLLAARYDEAAARQDVRGVKAERLPFVGLQAGIQYQALNGPAIGAAAQRGGFSASGVFPVAGVQLSVPLFTGGVTASRVRAAQAAQSTRLEEIGVIARQVVEAATNGLQGVAVARGQIVASRVQVSANTLALEGVRQENQVGSRTVLEVLNAEQELLSSQVTLQQAVRDEYVAAFTLLSALGRAEAVALGAPVERYDPAANARRVRGKWREFGYDPDPRTTPEVNHSRTLAGPPAP